MDTDVDVLSAIGRIVRTSPSNVSVLVDGAVQYSYSQLWHDAMKVASYLDSSNAGKLVGIRLERSYAYLPLILGVWMSGRAYVPFDTRWPPERSSHVGRLAGIDSPIDDALAQEAISMELNVTYTPKPVGRDQWAYVIFTSGTTGMPKGVVVSHNGLLNLARSQQRAFSVSHRSRYLWFLSPSFDASVSDILVALVSGATLVIESSDSLSLASKLMTTVEARKITHLDIPPSLLRLLKSEDVPECLDTIVIGGEAADVATAKSWASKVNLVNVYGPTEATVCTSLCKCSPQWSIPLIGSAIEGVEYSIRDSLGNEADEGELWISGDCLAVGYLNQPELTARKFRVVDGVRYYLTSDKVRRLPEGEFEFLGRIDRQLKFNGQLIEPEDIERNLAELKGIRRSAVIMCTTESGQRFLKAFVECDEADFSVGYFKECLSGLLPPWMVPNCFVRVDKLPETYSGKISYGSLKLLDGVDAVAECMGDVWTSKIVDAFCRALELPKVSPCSHLCELGATSLQTLVLISELEKIGVYLTTDDLKIASSPIDIARMKTHSLAMAKSMAELSPHWTNMPCYRDTDVLPQTSAHILLTGATGFLGSNMCISLLNAGCQVYCLVRCNSEVEGLNRVKNAFIKQRLMFSDSLLRGLHIVPGDITLPRLGISEQAYHSLAGIIDSVYHSAATVNMLAGFEALYDCNVFGVTNVLSFCCVGRHKTLHYASTLSVKVATDRNYGRVMESDSLDDVSVVFGGYAQTKVVADMMLQRIRLSQCRVKIYRYGLLCGSTLTGKSSPHDFLSMFFRGAKLCNALPLDTSGRLAVDVSPVDFVVDITTRLLLAPSEYSVFNIAGRSPLNYSILADEMLRCGVIEALLPYDKWRSVAENNLSPDARACVMALCRLDPKLFDAFRYMDLMQSTDMCFDMSRVAEILGPVNYPNIDSALLIKYFDYALHSV